tara:strand:+ start:307 stop:717 length:411 start_codon:yes stop_codon:yes gene_type:complete
MNKYIFYKKKKVLGISKNIYRIGKHKKEYLKHNDNMIHVDEYIKKIKRLKQLKQLKIKKGAGFTDKCRKGLKYIADSLDSVAPEPTEHDIRSLFNLIQKHLGWFEALRQKVADLQAEVEDNDNRIEILEYRVKSLL